MNAENNTLNYYDKNAKAYVANTINLDFHEVQDRFLSLLPADASILDFGCGSGRDTKYFLKKGFNVTAVDGSEELCKVASEATGISVKKMLFQELDESEMYDGIWACSSILHLNKNELKHVFHRMEIALKQGGYIYTSFKLGCFEGYRNQRYYIDFTYESFKEFIKDFPKLKIYDYWITNDIRQAYSEQDWLNLVIHKTGII